MPDWVESDELEEPVFDSSIAESEPEFELLGSELDSEPVSGSKILSDPELELELEEPAGAVCTAAPGVIVTVLDRVKVYVVVMPTVHSGAPGAQDVTAYVLVSQWSVTVTKTAP